MLLVFLYLCLAVLPMPVTLATGQNLGAVGCAEDGDCSDRECEQKCGCSRLYYFNETLKECVMNVEYFQKGMMEKHNTRENLEKEAENAFKGILISVMLFGACCAMCTLSACMYCCRINYTDEKLRRDVEALAHKLNRDGKSIKPKTALPKPAAQSCNIIVEDAGVFVV